MSAKRKSKSKANHPFVGLWHIYEMEMWDEDYFNMETQAYIEISKDGLGDFQFGLVTGQLDGYLEQEESGERFVFTWDGQDEMDPVNGMGWMRLKDQDEVEGLINFHLGDLSMLKAKRA